MNWKKFGFILLFASLAISAYGIYSNFQTQDQIRTEVVKAFNRQVMEGFLTTIPVRAELRETANIAKMCMLIGGFGSIIGVAFLYSSSSSRKEAVEIEKLDEMKEKIWPKSVEPDLEAVKRKRSQSGLCIHCGGALTLWKLALGQLAHPECENEKSM
ncbi:MAG: hypothetical protein Q7V20_14150 [Aquabacterium sp.]|uniref:hypothetical protein n=1 Tax=Aquabacterium sp. TaxID=1872578 RepID=UPI00271B5CCF|nr:hypothetical protein [Aquabacterium sp.]MDO9004586.1 hypothetical protein [Aquabacterium sp.]